MKYHLCLFIILFSRLANASIYQWSVPIESIVSFETNEHPTAFLWIPENCQELKSVVFSQQNMCEETLFDHPQFRKTMTELGFAIVWITPGIDQQWDVRNGCQKAFDQMMVDFANISGYDELAFIPVVPIGHSAMATFPWNFAAWNPDRTLAIISYKGDAPRTNLTGYGRENLEWGRKRNIDGIPGLMIEGEYEWWEARVNPGLAFRMMYPESCISFLCDVGQGHFDVSDKVVDYISLFLKKTAQYRLPKTPNINKSANLIHVNPHEGWFAERWESDKKRREKTAPFKKYKGDIHDAFWYFDEEMASATEAYYTQSKAKKHQYIGFIQNGKLLHFNEHSHERINGEFNPEKDGVTFYIDACFTDTLRKTKVEKHALGKPFIDKIYGPVEKVNDTTFTVRFNRMGLNNPRRTGDIWLLAHHPGDKTFKSSVQQFNMQIPFRLDEGGEQVIVFDSIPDQEKEIESLHLIAKASSGLPVYYYVKEGPAVVNGSQVVFTKIPPKSKYPIKVTVVAWQYGSANEPKIQTAKPLEKSFFIVNN